MWAMLLPLLLLLFMVVLAEGLELSEVIWANRRKRHFLPFPSDVDRSWPKVSIHVPAYNEPPEMLKKTLDALARLDYPNFEVLIIDNNTKDEKIWRPVEEYCATLGDRFRFFHVAPLKRSEEHTSELQSLMRISYAVFCLKKKKTINYQLIST